MEKKYFWQNKWVFILAAIGSAAGLGNLWRFPFQVYDHGGGAFIVAYLVMLFLMGLGLLIGEIAFGQYTQKGAPEAFGTISKYLKWLGWAGVLTGAVILSYYVVVIGRGMDYLWYSLVSLVKGASLPWADNSSHYFFNNVLHLTSGIDKLGNISFPVLIGTIVTWVLIYLFTFKSTKSVGKVVLVTATLPFLTLLILAIRGLTLPGATEGIKYLFHTDWSKLANIQTWIAAAGQIFFTLSLAMGIMIAYGALKKKDSEIVQSTILVALGNTLTSFLAAIAVFGTLGYLAHSQNLPIDKVAKGGPSLVFVIVPKTIALLPALQSLFAVIFFLTVFLLAIDSAMSLIEAVSVALRDKFANLKVEIVTLIVSVILGLISLIYVFGNGLYVLDIVDHFITSWSMLFIGMLEAILFVIVWKKLSQFIDERNQCFFKFIFNRWYYLLSWVVSALILFKLLYLNLKKGITYDKYPTQYLYFYGVYVVVGVYVVAVLLNIIDLFLGKDNGENK